MSDLKNEVLNTIKKHKLISENDKIVVRSFWWSGLYLPFRCIKKIKRGKNIKCRNNCSTCKPYA